ncbi:MAG: MIP/aquaporin family protein [Streptosporangiaceae bacterium]
MLPGWFSPVCRAVSSQVVGSPAQQQRDVRPRAAGDQPREAAISSQPEPGIASIQVPEHADVAIRSIGHPNAAARQFDFWDSNYEWRRLFSELFGTFLLVIGAVGAGMVNARFGRDVVPGPARVVVPALMVMAVILFMGAVSGAHLNPAISVGFALRGDFPWRRVPAYIAAQAAGAVLATLLLVALIGKQGDAGLTLPGPGISAGTALAWEVLLTTGLVSVVLGTASGAQQLGPVAAFGVGSYIALAGLFGAPVSGASMNPARSLGPALVLGDWTAWWAYLLGPVIGAVIAVPIAFILRGPGGGKYSTRAAQGTLGILWRPEPIGKPQHAPDRPDPDHRDPGGPDPAGPDPAGPDPPGPDPAEPDRGAAGRDGG